MCFDCFKSMRDEFGAVEITPAIVEAARLSQEANHYGPLHVTIEDYNCGDSSLAFCADQKRDKWTDADRACLAAFEALNENERTHALALADGYLDASGQVAEAWREWDVPVEEIAAVEAEPPTAPRHCEDYLDDPTQPECLRRFLDYQCRPAALKYPTADEAFNRGMEEHLGLPMWRDPVPLLFARHEGRTVRVTLASSIGDVGITEDLDAQWGYSKRVAMEDLTDFTDERPEPRVVVKVAVDWNSPSWGGGNLGSPGGPAAVASHYRMLADISAPGIRGFQGNRAERRAAAARARRRA